MPVPLYLPLDDVEANGIAIIPNPFDSEFSIAIPRQQTHSSEQVIAIHLINELGQKIPIKIEMTEFGEYSRFLCSPEQTLANGVYYVEVKMSQGVFLSKLIH